MAECQRDWFQPTRLYYAGSMPLDKRWKRTVTKSRLVSEYETGAKAGRYELALECGHVVAQQASRDPQKFSRCPQCFRDALRSEIDAMSMTLDIAIRLYPDDPNRQNDLLHDAYLAGDYPRLESELARIYEANESRAAR